MSVLDAAGRVLSSARVPLRPYHSPAPGRWEHPGDDLWDSVALATRRALDGFTGDVARIVGVGLCTIRFCRALLREDGGLAQPVMSWMDERVARPHEQGDHVAWVTTSSGYLGHRLTGRQRDAAGNYQGMWPIDVARWAWSEDSEAYRACGMRREQLFELVEPGGVLGEVTPEASRLTGLPVGVPVVATSNDKAVEALGAGLRGDDRVLLSLGTYIAAMADDARLRPPAEGHWQNFGSVPGRYLSESDGIRRGMWTPSWFRRLVSGDGPEFSEAQLDAEAEGVELGSGGLVAVLDWLAPAERPNLRGALLGFDGTHTRAHIHRAIFEAIAFTMHANVARMEASRGVQARVLLATGGGSASRLAVRILADVFGLPVRRPENPDAAGVGAAICAAVATGVHAGWDQAQDAMVRLEPAVQPEPDAVARYRSLEPRFHHLVAGVRALFDAAEDT